MPAADPAMDIKKLKGFRAVVVHGSPGAAAASMHLSQPGMSRLISSLEDELKLKLFQRERRKLLLTREGRAFYRETERILAGLDELPSIVSDIKAGGSRRLRIVALARTAGSLVVPALGRFIRAHPNQHCSLDVRGRRDMEHWVAGRHYDMGVAVSLPCDQPGVICQPLYKARAVAMIPAGHPLAAHAHVCARDLAPYPMIGVAPGLRPRQQLDEIFSAAGIEKSYQIETTSSPLACQLVTEGLGITVIDELTARSADNHRFVLRDFEPAYWLRFGVILPEDQEQPPLLDDFIVCLREQIISLLGSQALQVA